MATKSSKKMKKPSKAMIRDLNDLFQKYNWSGGPIGLAAPSLGAALAECPAGKTPKEVSYQENGVWVNKTICV